MDLGPWRGRVYLAGGLAPRYLIGRLPEGARAHVGTADVDLVIGLALGDGTPETLFFSALAFVARGRMAQTPMPRSSPPGRTRRPELASDRRPWPRYGSSLGGFANPDPPAKDDGAQASEQAGRRGQAQATSSCPSQPALPWREPHSSSPSSSPPRGASSRAPGRG